MNSTKKLLLIISIVLALGLGSVDLILRAPAPLGAQTWQIWTSWPSQSFDNAAQMNNPYIQAHIARNGQLPLAPQEGLLLQTWRDSASDPLMTECSYRLSGEIPASPLWTLTVTDLQGRVLPHPSQRHSLSSKHLLRKTDGGFEIWLSTDAQPGNWLPLGAPVFDQAPRPAEPTSAEAIFIDDTDNAPFMLSLRLYGASISGNIPRDDIEFPILEKVNCS